jgi:hypothetical protein
MKLHIGKLSKELSFTVTDEFAEMLTDRARAHHCSASVLIREAVYKAFTGDSYSGHVAKDMHAALSSIPGTIPEMTPNSLGEKSGPTKAAA